MVLRVLLVIKVPPVIRAKKVLMESRDKPETKVLLVLKESKAHNGSLLPAPLLVPHLMLMINI